MNNKWTNKITLIGTIVAIIGGGGILGWYKMCTKTDNNGEKWEPMIYQGSVQDNVTREYISGAEITFSGLTNKIPTRQTDSKGCFSISLSEEYYNVIITITHKDYEYQEFNRQLIEKHLKVPDIFYLTPRNKGKSNGISPPPTIDSARTRTNNPIGSTQKKEKIEATGESSGFYKSEKLALEAAEKDAENKLSHRLKKSNLSYEIDDEKSTVYLVNGSGYKAKIVIYTYK